MTPQGNALITFDRPHHLARDLSDLRLFDLADAILYCTANAAQHVDDAEDMQLSVCFVDQCLMVACLVGSVSVECPYKVTGGLL